MTTYQLAALSMVALAALLQLHFYDALWSIYLSISRAKYRPGKLGLKAWKTCFAAVALIDLGLIFTLTSGAIRCWNT